MQQLSFPAFKSILCLGAHSDDIEIGCGGTILTLADQCPHAHICWIVFSAIGPRHDEARRSAEAFTARFADRTIELRQFRDGFFPYSGPAVKDAFEQIKQAFRPDLILTHYGRDLHQDHRAVSELTWNTWRDHLVLEYEIAKYDGDLGAPNVFVPLDENRLEMKIEYLMKHFETQSRKQWFDPVAFRGLARIRGIECNSPTGYAEAFFGRKIMLGST
ncbi:PIG-L family deacetylase [bacterium]|nr:PIG-L family deacetylase [bacterium]